MNIVTNYIDINWWSSTLTEYVLHPFIMITLCLLSVFVVLGNLLVVSAIWHEHQLHSVTNYLIASLAAADCLVGAVVMPFSIVAEIIIGSWTFGEAWCDLWHSFDVLASTASIMNLCAISLDRYLAITDPISYPSRMTPKRVALLIVSLWTCSSLISFPAILWWRAVGQSPLQQMLSSTTTTISPEDILSTSSHLSYPEDLQYKCVFTDDPYYLLFSSFISFYGPLCVMLYAYYRIYKAAVQQTRFLKHGSKEVMIGRNKRKKVSRHLSEHSREGFNEKTRLNETSCTGLSEMESYDRQHLVLRVHRGGGGGGTNASIRKFSNGDIGNTKNQSNDAKKRERYQNFGTCNAKILSNPTSEAKTNVKIAQPTNNLNQIGTSSFESPLNDTVSRVRSSSWRDRSDTTSSKRDKFRVESQRFDSAPLESSLCTRENLLEVLILPKSGDVKVGNLEHSSINERSLKELNKTQIGTCTKDSLILRGKPSQAFINSRSTTIDVSILNRSNQIRNGAQRVKSSSEFTARRFRSVNSSHSSLRDSSFIYTEDEVVLGKGDGCSSDNARCDNIPASESVSISSSGSSGSSGSGSSSSSSGNNSSSGSSSSKSSYGTGSLASVIVRPRENQKNTANNSHTKDHNCDTDESLQGNPRVRRALSFGEARHKELESKKNRIEVHENIGDEQLGIIFRNKQRASLDDSSSKNSYTNTGSKASIAMNIRSWVKLPRAKPRKQRTFRDSVLIKPPPSLMPLIKMHSDISADSSNAATSVIKLKGGRGLRHNYDEDSSYELDLVEGNTVDKFEQDRQEIRLSSKENNGTEKQVDKILTFKDLERGKGCNKHQMLHYNSDKLIQSIVDLNAISYIDSAKSNSKIDVKAIECKAEAASEVEKMNLESSEQVQLTDNSRINIPHRQHRSVGKKLSKLAKERKAAKTLGIVVGVFILCWLPFFVVNIVVALCGSNCIYKLQILVPIVTWLGWLNSAMNPVIYACWSRDFRRAFRRVLCSWVEFVCPYDGAYMATKLKLKKCSNYSGADAYLSRNVSSIKGNTSSATIRSGMSIDGRGVQNGGVSRSLLILSEA